MPLVVSNCTSLDFTVHFTCAPSLTFLLCTFLPLLVFVVAFGFWVKDKAGHTRMYRLSQKAGIKMDLFRCDGDKGMAGLPHQYGCAKHKFETFRRPRKLNGIQQPAYIPGRAPKNGNHPGLYIYLQACREMTEGPKIVLLGELIQKHGHKKSQAAFKDELYRSLPQIDLVESVMLGKEPLGEITNNTVEGGNSRLKTEGLKDLPPVDFFNQTHAMERDYWTRELEACLAWIKKTVRFVVFFAYFFVHPFFFS